MSRGGSVSRPYSRPEAVSALAFTYRSILAEFAASGQATLRLVPVSAVGALAGSFGGAEAPAMAREALEAGFAGLGPQQRARLLTAAEVHLCLADPEACAAFAASPGFPSRASAVPAALLVAAAAATAASAVEAAEAAEAAASGRSPPPSGNVGGASAGRGANDDDEEEDAPLSPGLAALQRDSDSDEDEGRAGGANPGRPFTFVRAEPPPEEKARTKKPAARSAAAAARRAPGAKVAAGVKAAAGTKVPIKRTPANTGGASEPASRSASKPARGAGGPVAVAKPGQGVGRRPTPVSTGPTSRSRSKADGPSSPTSPFSGMGTMI